VTIMKDIPKALLELVLFIGKNKLKRKDETVLARFWGHDKAQVCRLVKLGVATSLIRTETKYKLRRVWLTRSGEQLAWKLRRVPGWIHPRHMRSTWSGVGFSWTLHNFFSKPTH